MSSMLPRLAVLLPLALASLLPVAAAQDDRYLLHSADTAVTVGHTFELPIYLDVQTGTLGAPCPVDGWEYAFCDLSGAQRFFFLSVVEGLATSTINNGLPAHFRTATLHPTAFSVTTLIDFTGAHTLPAGSDHELDRLLLRHSSSAYYGALELGFCTLAAAPDVEVWLGTASILATHEAVTVSSFAPIDDRYHVWMENAHLAAGAVAELSLTLDAIHGTNGAPVAVHGWSVGVCHDPAALSIIDAVLGSDSATANGGNEPAFNAINVQPAGGTGFYHGVVIDLFGTFTLPSGTDLELLVVSYDTLAAPATSTQLSFCTDFDFSGSTSPLVVLPGTGVEPIAHDGTVTVVSAYLRGDCNSTGGTDLADAIFLLSYLFSQGAANVPTCPRACDTDANGSINLVDAVRLLDSLFSPLATPLPRPNACGSDDLPHIALDCATFPGCP